MMMYPASMFPNKRIVKEITGATSPIKFNGYKNQNGCAHSFKRDTRPAFLIPYACTITNKLKAKVPLKLTLDVGFCRPRRPIKLLAIIIKNNVPKIGRYSHVFSRKFGLMTYMIALSISSATYTTPVGFFEGSA